jgi:hypothetical protein
VGSGGIRCGFSSLGNHPYYLFYVKELLSKLLAERTWVTHKEPLIIVHKSKPPISTKSLPNWCIREAT